MIELPAVYYVEMQSSAGEETELAIKPTFNSEKRACWRDASGHGRTVDYISNIDIRGIDVQKYIKDSQQPHPNNPPANITIVDRYKNRTYSLYYLTLEKYNEKVRDVVAFKPVFSSTEELQQYYIDHF